MNIEKAIKNMKLRGFEVSFFENKEAASDYLVSQIKDTSVGIGGSKTVEQMGLYEKLCEAGNDVAWHWKTPGWDTLDRETAAKVFISSANAIVAGTNKICPDFDSALYRARNTAAVQNMKRFPCQTPCKIDDKCHDCRVADRGCNALMVLWGPMMDMEKVEIVLINEDLGM